MVLVGVGGLVFHGYAQSKLTSGRLAYSIVRVGLDAFHEKSFNILTGLKCISREHGGDDRAMFPSDSCHGSSSASRRENTD